MFRQEMEHDARMLGHALEGPFVNEWRVGREKQALQLLRDANQDEHRIRVRCVWLDETPGEDFAPRAPISLLRDVSPHRNVASVQHRDAGGERLYTYIPVDVEGSRPGALELSESLSRLHAYLRTTLARRRLL